jgi:hypothetical protein
LATLSSRDTVAAADVRRVEVDMVDHDRDRQLMGEPGSTVGDTDIMGGVNTQPSDSAVLGAGDSADEESVMGSADDGDTDIVGGVNTQPSDSAVLGAGDSADEESVMGSADDS